jgi:hypothetical protein
MLFCTSHRLQPYFAPAIDFSLLPGLEVRKINELAPWKRYFSTIPDSSAKSIITNGYFLS